VPASSIPDNLHCKKYAKASDAMDNVPGGSSIGLASTVRSHDHDLASSPSVLSRGVDTHMLTRASALLLTLALAGCAQSMANPPSSLQPGPTGKQAASRGTNERIRQRPFMVAQRTINVHEKVKTARVAKPARAAMLANPLKPDETNDPALGLKLLAEPQRIAVFQDRLRGLCEIAEVEQVTSDSWRASCTKGDAFIIKVYSDGFMTVTRS
jgi:hypothetical protein